MPDAWATSCKIKAVASERLAGAQFGFVALRCAPPGALIAIGVASSATKNQSEHDSCQNDFGVISRLLWTSMHFEDVRRDVARVVLLPVFRMLLVDPLILEAAGRRSVFLLGVIRQRQHRLGEGRVIIAVLDPAVADV